MGEQNGRGLEYGIIRVNQRVCFGFERSGRLCMGFL